MYHDVDATNFGYKPGQVPGMAVSFTADESMRRLALEAVAEAAPDIHAFEGRVVSGDQFVREPDAKARLAVEFDGRCCEMEGAAIAHACWLNGIPFVIVRAISDKADGSKSELYPVFEEEAARNCARIVRTMVAEGFPGERAKVES